MNDSAKKRIPVKNAHFKQNTHFGRSITMLLPEEQCVVNWLYQYGALPKIQVMKMLDMPEEKAERLLYTLRRSLRITEVLDGTYIALDPLAKPDQRIIQAVWVLAKFINKLDDPKDHYAANYPSQVFFLKENIGYEIIVLYEGEESQVRLLQPDEDLKFIIVVPDISMAPRLQLPDAPCLLATVKSCGDSEPVVTFYSQEDGTNGKD